jgi:hypothetical protein
LLLLPLMMVLMMDCFAAAVDDGADGADAC